MSKKVIIDTDPGIDDAIAIALAFASPELKVVAITTTGGNISRDLTFKNAYKLCNMFSPKFIPPIGIGKDIKCPRSKHIHGRDGLGNTNLPDVPIGKKINSDDLLIEVLENSDEPIGIIAIAPLTNIKNALQKKPKIIEKIKRLTIMGGAIKVQGNVSPFAEFNIHSDAHAANFVFRSPVPITLVPLDVTHKCIFTEAHLEKLAEKKTAVSHFFKSIIEFSIARHQKYQGINGAYLHDALAVGVVIDKGLIVTERLSLQVETEDKQRMGHVLSSIPTFFKSPSIDVALKVKNERFLEFLIERLKKYT